MNWLSRMAIALTLLSAGAAFFEPNWQGVGTIFVIAAAVILWVTREVGHVRNQRLRRQVLQLGGSVEGLDSKIDGNHPARHSAAAITGQGELATWNYATLIERMRRDGHLPEEQHPDEN